MYRRKCSNSTGRLTVVEGTRIRDGGVEVAMVEARSLFENVGRSRTGNIVVTPVYIRRIDLRNFREKSRDVEGFEVCGARGGGRVAELKT